jgi:glycosyltransferase involved in cell wall biosynthesis
MIASRKSLVVEGWRGINHSFALVNQFQLLAILDRTDLDLFHVDAPFYLPHWSRAINGAGFHASDEEKLSSIPTPDSSTISDWTYRIYSSTDLRPPKYSKKLAVYLVTELGLDEQSFAPGSDIAEFEAAGGVIGTPSNWSRERIIDWGFKPETVHVVPHGTSPDYFFPLAAETIRSQRTALGFAENEVFILNIGTAIWNKGIDVLLKGFALARQKRKDLRLIFKDQRNTYGMSGDNYIQTTLSNAGLLSEDVINAITLIPANLTLDQMNVMYNIADCYVSPYRAEGFNLPVCEAMACGTPVLVTQGGATDDFVHGPGHRMVASTLNSHVVIQGRNISAYREPDVNDLVNQLAQTQAKALPSRSSGNSSWEGQVDVLLDLLN